MQKILLGLTTTPGSNWKEKIEEIKRYKIEEVALFPTFLFEKDRQDLYSLLDGTDLKRLPHVHLRNDMGEDEIEMFQKKYKTEVFNLHPWDEDKILLEKIKDISQKIFIENSDSLNENFFELIKVCGGICFDVSHFHDFGIVQKHRSYENFFSLLSKYKVGCCHVSAVKEGMGVQKNFQKGYETSAFSDHHLDKNSELDYVKKYKKYLPNLISIELENSFKEQLAIKEYLKNLLK